VDVGGGLSRFISWRLCQKIDQEFKWQVESFDEQPYSLHVFNILSPIIEGSRVDFFA
jgi:hypothetical protein